MLGGQKQPQGKRRRRPIIQVLGRLAQVPWKSLLLLPRIGTFLPSNEQREAKPFYALRTSLPSWHQTPGWRRGRLGKARGPPAKQRQPDILCARSAGEHGEDGQRRVNRGTYCIKRETLSKSSPQ
jgi:hypothetical protein